MKNFKMTHKRLVIILHDLAVSALAWALAFWLRFNFTPSLYKHLPVMLHLLPLVVILQSVASWVFGLYRGVWRFASLPDLALIIKAVVTTTAALIVSLLLFDASLVGMVPRSIFMLYPLVAIMLMGGSRFAYRWARERGNFFVTRQRVLVVGAGQAGERIVRNIRCDMQNEYKPVAFLDDQVSRQGQEVQGVRIVGRCEDIPAAVKKYDIDLIVIAMPSANSSTMRRILSYCEQSNTPIRTLPGLNDLVSGQVQAADLREVSIEDLLGREQVELDWGLVKQEIAGKTIVVTGGGGSIGSRLCFQLAKLSPKQLIIVDHSEYNLYKIEQEFEKRFKELNYVVRLVNVTDRVAVASVLSEYEPSLLFHVAAYKHVPLLENQLNAAMHNNLFGTIVLAEEADKHGVEKFVFISTDKAVNPANIMGATKRAAEIFCQSFNAQSKTNFLAVRFGNVLGSRGSVLPLFREQLKEGGPITVTHPEITRYFMTIPEAALLILQASAMGKGGEIFVLDMGEPIKIAYLAEQLVRLSGKELGKDIEIQYTGLRPGEKMYEELFYEGEMLGTKHGKIMQAQLESIPWQALQSLTEKIKKGVHSADNKLLADCLLTLVKDYHPKKVLAE